MTQYWQTLSYFAYTQGIIFNKYFKGVQCWLVILADKGTLEGFAFYCQMTILNYTYILRLYIVYFQSPMTVLLTLKEHEKNNVIGYVFRK